MGTNFLSNAKTFSLFLPCNMAAVKNLYRAFSQDLAADMLAMEKAALLVEVRDATTQTFTNAKIRPKNNV